MPQDHPAVVCPDGHVGVDEGEVVGVCPRGLPRPGVVVHLCHEGKVALVRPYHDPKVQGPKVGLRG